MTALEGFADVVLAVGMVPSMHRPDVRFLCKAEDPHWQLLYLSGHPRLVY